jgi:hypothetical protein
MEIISRLSQSMALSLNCDHGMVGNSVIRCELIQQGYCLQAEPQGGFATHCDHGIVSCLPDKSPRVGM